MTQDQRKQLECLFSWAQLYARAQQWDALVKCEAQIDAYKRLHEIT